MTGSKATPVAHPPARTQGSGPFGTLFAEAGVLGDRNGTFSVLLPLLGRFQPSTRNTYPHAANASPIDQCEPRVSASPLPQATFSEIKIQFCIPSLTLSVGDTLWKRHVWGPNRDHTKSMDMGYVARQGSTCLRPKTEEPALCEQLKAPLVSSVVL